MIVIMVMIVIMIINTILFPGKYKLTEDYNCDYVIMITHAILFSLRKWGPHKKQRRKYDPVKDLEEDPEKEVASVLCLFPGS